jgi:ABC-type protease/lipase transport system fused ATPase/permease subunit
MAKKSKKMPVDNSEFYKSTEHPIRDHVYNGIVARYGKKGNKWEKSDTFVWGGAIYQLWDMFWIVVFIYIVWFIVTWTYDRYGMFKAIVTLAIFFLIRINSLVRQMAQANRYLKKLADK